MPDLDVRLYRDGGQSSLDVAREVAAFFAAAERTLDLALYDIRLTGEAGEVVTSASKAARLPVVELAQGEAELA